MQCMLGRQMLPPPSFHIVPIYPQFYATDKSKSLVIHGTRHPTGQSTLVRKMVTVTNLPAELHEE